MSPVPSTLDERGRALVADHPLVRPLTDGQRDHVARSVSVERLDPGDALIEVGDPPGPLVLVLEGRATVRRAGREVGQVGPGSWVGELSLLEDRPDRARVEADDTMLVAVVRGEDVEKMLSLEPVAERIGSLAARRRAANRAGEVTPVETTTATGTQLWLRPLVAADWTLYAAGEHRVSTRSLYMRFFSAPPRTEARFRQLTDVDLRSAFAWAAFEEDTLVGVGRHGLLTEDRATAELAVLVADDRQRRGIGRVLVEAAVVAAAAHRAERLLAIARVENEAIRRLLGDLGATFEAGPSEGIVEARWPVAAAVERISDEGLCERLRAVAETVLAPVLGE